MEQVLKRILTGTTGWDQIYEKLAIRNEIEVTSVGKLFEQFCKYYYLAEPSVASDYKNVWLYEEAPREVKEKLNLAQSDHGVDIILEDMEGGYSVVQCKFRGDQDSRLSWSKDKIANLFAEADKADFIIVFTNASDIDEYSKGKQAEKFSLVTQGELVEIQPETIRKMVELIENKPIPVVPLRTPREDQVVAIKKVLAGFQDNDRGQLILPCGAGKTLAALWIRECMDSKHTLVLVPSLALLRQTKNEWHSTQKKWQPYLCVCSEGDIDRGPDMPMVHTYEIGGRVTTDPNVIRDFLGRHERATIYSTYQSLDAIIEAIKPTDFQFDLAICDEAHKTAGSKLGTFGNIHNNALVPVKKRLYMTATPRIVSEQVKNRLGEDITKYLADMGDIKTFGPEFHRMSFAEAIDKGILVDYQIIAIGVSDAELQSQLLERQFAGDTETTIDDIANNYALEKVMEKHGATHAITFHSSVRRADQFKKRHQKLYTDVFSGHVSGRQTTNERNVVMSQFKNSQKAVVTNARCLTEGVDVPAIDVVYFCDPKNSKIDIVQASGRALRTAVHKNKQMGHIVVPIFHKNQESVEDTIEGSAFKNLITVVRALCDHDERLVDEITKIKVGKGIRQVVSQSTHIQIETAIPLIVLEDFEKNLKESIFDQVIERTADNWLTMYGLLKQFRQLNPTRWPSSTIENPDERKLGLWCLTKRQAFKKGELTLDRKKALDDIGFQWDPYEEDFQNNLNLLKDFRSKNPNEWPSQISDNKSESKLGGWCTARRKDFKKGKLLRNRVKALEDLGFSWDVLEVEFQRNLKLLKEFRQKNPNKWPRSTRYIKDIQEKKLGVWCVTTRRSYKNGKLSSNRIIALNKIGFPWDSDEEDFNKNLTLVKKFRQMNLNMWPSPSSDDTEERILGAWLTRIREKQKLGILDPKYKKLLECLGDDAWNPIDRQIIKNLILLREFRHKNSDIWPSSTSNDPTEKALGRWLVRTIKKFKRGILSSWEKDRLDDLNFQWEPISYKFAKNLKLLKQFLEINHGKWPQEKESGNPNEKKLAIWCKVQRSYAKKNELSPGNKKALDNLGFIWSPYLGNFQSNLDLLKEFRKRNPDKWPNSNSKDANERWLGLWCHYRRQAFKKGKLTLDKKKDLDNLGFQWDPYEEDFQRNMDLLKDFRNKNPNKWPSQGSKNLFVKKLAQWCSGRRRAYRNGSLSEYQKKALDEIGFQWNPCEKDFQKNLNLLKDFRSKNPNKWPNQDSKDLFVKKLGIWCSRKRKAYHKGSLNEDQKKALDEIGFSLDPWGESFRENVRLLREFRQKNPNEWPKQYSKDPFIRKLGAWCLAKRRAYKIGNLSDDQEKALDEIGFPFSLK